MKNQYVARILYEIADMLEIMEVDFKPAAYRKAAQVIESLSEDISKITKEGRLEDLPGIGENIANKVREIVVTGKLKYYTDLKRKIPVDVESLLAIEGVGPKTVKLLYKKLKVKNVKDLDRVAKHGKLHKIKGLGEKAEKNIIEGIKFAALSGNRMLLGYVLKTAREIEEILRKNKHVKDVSIAGSLRRRKETIGDMDILTSSKNPKKVVEFFTNMRDVKNVIARGMTKSSIKTKDGIQVDLRVVHPDIYGSALQYFTGSKEHNIVTRRIAIEKGMKLSEYGLSKGKNIVAGRTEKDVYKKLGLTYIEPELRENNGEIEAAAKNKLPKLIGYNDIKGDLQMHSTWSDGRNTIKEMALRAQQIKYEYICITDHTGILRIANGLDEKRLIKQGKEILRLNKQMNIRILHGVEVNIKADGKLDIKNSILKDLDIVVAAIHTGFKGTREKMTSRISNAMHNDNVDIIAHPTGRLIQKRRGYELNFDKLFDISKATKTYLEINAMPHRLDMNDINTRAAIEAGCKVSINTDAHHTDHLRFMEFGVATARRGWVQKKDVINTLTMKKLEKLIEF